MYHAVQLPAKNVLGFKLLLWTKKVLNACFHEFIDSVRHVSISFVFVLHLHDI